MIKLVFLFFAGFLSALSAADPGLRFVAGDRPAGMSAAVIVDRQALAHTAQVFATGLAGEAPSGDARVQVERTLDNIARALEPAGAGLDRLVRLNVYVAAANVTPVVEAVLARRFTGAARPTVAFVAGVLPIPGAFVAMDAVAAVAPSRTTEVARHGGARETTVAVLPQGPVLFISGRAEPGDLKKASRDTMEKLGADLEHLGLQKRDVVQVKAFVSPISETDTVREQIRAFFGKDAPPPLVFVEWQHPSRPVEIELVAAARAQPGEAGSSAAIDYVTPPGEKPNAVFTRLVRVNRGALIYTAGLVGPAGDAETQMRGLFARLRDLLRDCGSDFEHMAKATYYVTDAPASTWLNTIRTEQYNPQRTPAASKISVTGSGRTNHTVTLDVIAVIP